METMWEPLGGGMRVLVSRCHRFGTDAVLLARFAAPRKGEAACDLGTGCGIIPLLWCRQAYPEPIVGVELQPDACALARRSAEGCGVTGRFSVVESDLKELKGKLPHGSFGLVTCNPPYKAPGAGLKNALGSHTLARHEVACTLADVARAAAGLLKPGGRFCVCHRPERLCDLFSAMRESGIEPKRLRLVCQRPDSGPWLVLAEGRRGGRPALRIDPTLIMERDGGPSDEMRQIYGDYLSGGKQEDHPVSAEE